MLGKLTTILKHLWLDASDARRAIPPDMLQRLARRVAASERRHSGEIRICVEASLPLSYLWRLDRHTSIAALTRQRAVTLFGKLRVWDTEHNNGVLIYVLLAEHAIEIVADRGLARQVGPDQWQAMVTRMAAAFREQRYEDGLTQALEETSAVLMQHFAVDGSEEGAPARANELPDAPQLQ
ncbi:putative membrane protein [Polaromonas sp. CF318]|uniref:TPM domain-containing protein n=1 Tax=Polaromonas sp. CF318 TaxID=1144318 RepID=UPI000270F235|nr:TPM domain-containing protein [Polaromonas sp. CF318]EJL83701.1 putative membrane protein [Polaromonas sp. CF318]